eukprot:Em0005g1241a
MLLRFRRTGDWGETQGNNINIFWGLGLNYEQKSSPERIITSPMRTDRLNDCANIRRSPVVVALNVREQGLLLLHLIWFLKACVFEERLAVSVKHGRELHPPARAIG